jgi:hypothetical protein
MKKDIPEIQVVYLTEKYVPARNNKTTVQRGDYPVMMIHAPNPVATPRALVTAYQANRLADVWVVVLEDGKEFTYEAREFETRISKFIGSASRPGATVASFLETFTGKIK